MQTFRLNLNSIPMTCRIACECLECEQRMIEALRAGGVAINDTGPTFLAILHKHHADEPEVPQVRFQARPSTFRENGHVKSTLERAKKEDA